MKRGTVWLVNALVMAVAVGLAAAVAEVGLRLFFPQPMGVFHEDRDGLAMHWPRFVTYLPQFGQTVRFNSAWMRDREHKLQKEPGVYRILLLGDSFTEALQVPFDATFASVLEQALERKAGRPVEVINAGVSGWGTDDELHYLTVYGVRWQPDLVLVAMTLHNDISDNLREQWHTLRDGELVDRPVHRASFLAYKVTQLKGFLATHSYLYQLCRRVEHRSDMRETATELKQHVARLFLKPESDVIARGLRLTALELGRIEAVAAAHHAHAALVLIPLSAQLSPPSVTQPGGGITPSLQDNDRPQRLLTTIADSLRFPTIDLLPVFTHSTKEYGDLYLQEGHWNATGHHIAADSVAAALVEKGIVP
jgi:hypothetical protein